MKSFGVSASVGIGTNKIVSSTLCNWAKVKIGSFFKFKNDESWFKIVNIKNLYWIKDFNVKHRNIITIPEIVFPYLGINDELQITYKEYELAEVRVVSDPGKKYAINEIVYFNGGLISRDLDQSAAIKVLATNEAGEIVHYEVFNKGKYLVVPEGECTSFSSGVGSGAKFYCSFKEIESRGLTDRKIVSINFIDGNTVIALNSPLPEGLKIGKLSVKKWEVLLENNYFARQSNVVSEPYEIITDFILDSGIPKLIRGHINPDLIINQGFETLYRKILELDSEIKKLKDNQK